MMNYIANSVNPDGVRAQEIIESLKEDITEELGHAQQFATRIKELYGVVPASDDFTANSTACNRRSIRPTSSTSSRA